MSTKAISQYLEKYAEPEASQIPSFDRHYTNVLVIPAFCESYEQLCGTWQSLNNDTLIILVINSTEHDETTLELFDTALSQQTVKHQKQHIHFTHGDYDLVIVDRCHEGLFLDRRDAVGHARKIGFDIALALIERGCISSGLIGSTDADAELPSDYFDQPINDDVAAIVYPFTHTSEAELSLAVQLYEISMLHYAVGLSQAGSIYGFTSIGSALAVNASHYARVRGFPKKNAAEDFYLLNKLAKSGGILKSRGKKVIIEGRLSDRVPFGTGPGVSRIMRLQNPLEDYFFYHPQSFDILAEFLDQLRLSWQTPGTFDNASEPVKAFYAQLNLDPVLCKQRSMHKQKDSYLKFTQDWFDGFRTLKFIHFLRDNYLPEVPLHSLGYQMESVAAIRAHLHEKLFSPA